MLKRDWTESSNVNNHSTVNNEHNWMDLCIKLRINVHTLPTTTTESGKSDFRFVLFAYVDFIIDLLVQFKFCYVNLINRSWRMWKTKHITPTCLIGDNRLLKTQVRESQSECKRYLCVVIWYLSSSQRAFKVVSKIGLGSWNTDTNNLLLQEACSIHYNIANFINKLNNLIAQSRALLTMCWNVHRLPNQVIVDLVFTDRLFL